MKKVLLIATAISLISATVLAKPAQVSVERTTGGNEVRGANIEKPSTDSVRTPHAANST